MYLKCPIFLLLLLSTLTIHAQVFKDNGFIIDEATGEEYKLTTQQSYNDAEGVVLKASNYWLGVEECPYDEGTFYMRPFIAEWVKGNKKYNIKGEKQIWDLFDSDKYYYGKFMYFASLVKVAIEHQFTEEVLINEKARAFFIDYALDKRNKVKLSRSQKKALQKMKEEL